MVTSARVLRRWASPPALLACSFFALSALCAATDVRLASEGKALVPIVVTPAAEPETISLARELSAALSRMTGANFSVEQSTEAKGIVLGTGDDWKNVLPDVEPGFSPSYATEDYTIKTDGERLFLVGRSPAGTRNAVWDFLYRLGFRQFFPGKHWEIWPEQRELTIRFDVMERPAFYSRNFSFPGRTKNSPEVVQWEQRNRLQGGFTLRAQHAYGAIIKRNADHFQRFPEDVIPADKDVKLDPSRPSVLEVAVADSLRLLKRYPEWNSISMEPSDGGNWRPDSPLGSPSNQAVTLANHVARSLREEMPERNVKVGLLAYHLHSPPPDIPVDRDVVVRVATAYIQGGYAAESLLTGWKNKGAETGISEFLSIWSWDYGLPGRSRASDLEYVADSISTFYALGARHWNAQATGSWAPDGLGYFLAARLLWGGSNAGDPKSLVRDFFEKSFGPAAQEMQNLYEECLLKNGRVMFSEDLIARMYRHLKAALGKTTDETVRLRILDYAVYARYLELVLAGRTHHGPERKRAGDALMSLATNPTQTFMLNMDLVLKRPPIPLAEPDGGAQASAQGNEENSGSLLKWIDAGIAKHSVWPFETKGFSANLVPGPRDAKPIGDTKDILICRDNCLRLFAGDQPGKFAFTLTGAMLYSSKGPIKLRLFAENNPLVNEPVAEREVLADKTPQAIVLESAFPGLHRLEISDGGGGTKISWPVGQRVVLPVSPDAKTVFLSRFRGNLSFYVPPGCRVIGGYSSGPTGRMLRPDGEVALNFSELKGPSHFSVDVPVGMDGKVWSFSDSAGDKILLTVPPWVARNGSELLVPIESLADTERDPAS